MALENPLSILYDTKGVELAVSASQVMETNPSGSDANAGVLVAGSGSDGVVRFFQVADDGALFVTGTLQTTVGAVDQGNHGTADQSWYMVITDGSSSAALGSSSTNSLWITGSTTVDNVVTITPDGGSLTIDDGGGSITVDGTVTANVTGTVNLDRGNAPGDPLWISGTVDVQGPDGTPSDPVYVTGSFAIDFNPNPSATVTQVAASVTSVTLAAANISRRALSIWHEGTKNLYVKLGATATTTSFTAKLSAKGYYEVPGNYTGIVDGIWDSAGGPNAFAMVTEVTD
jgi:hypothetical protein